MIRYTERIYLLMLVMETTEILESLPQLNTIDQLKIAETALQLVQLNRQTLTKEQRRQQMEIAAIAAVDDYAQNSDLIAFTALDEEDFLDEFNNNSQVI
jgi:bacterioferritin (cytochrome b1)